MFIKILIFIIFAELLFGANDVYVICVENLKHDNLKIDSNIIKTNVNVLSTEGLIPVFPVKSMPNILSISTGLLPINHGIISNNFIDPVTGDNFSINNKRDLKSSDNYNGIFIWEYAKKNRLKTSSYNWPSSNMFSLRKSVDYPVFTNESDSTLLEYFDYIDTLGTKLNLIYLSAHSQAIVTSSDTSKSYNNTIDKMNQRINSIVSRIELSESDIIIVSTGGYSSLLNGKIISIEDVFLGIHDYDIQNYGSYAFVNATDSTLQKIKLRIDKIDKIQSFFVDETPVEFNIRNSFLSDQLLLLAENGCLISENVFELDKLNIKNANGYDPFSSNMIGTFIGIGNGFKNIKTGSVLVIDIYPLIIELLELNQHNLIDGDPNKIKSFLTK